MSEQQQTLLSRVGRWFKWSHGSGSVELPLAEHIDGNGNAIQPTVKRRMTLFPWVRRDEIAAMQDLQSSFNALAASMIGTLRELLEKQNQRQDELMRYLAHLPAALQAIPESNRAMGEALQAIQQQMEDQNTQSRQLGEILRKVGDAASDQRDIIEAMRDRVEMLHQHNSAISDSMHTVGNAMESVGRNSQASTEVLQAMRDNLSARDVEIQGVLKQQTNRVTLMMTTAVVMSVVTLLAVGIVGYLILSAR